MPPVAPVPPVPPVPPVAPVPPVVPGGAVAEGDAVVVEDVHKGYGGRPVLRGLTFAVRRGETLALLGPNGAGKTTTVELLEGYRRADRGRVRVLGLDPVADGRALKPRVGIMLQAGGISPQIRPLEALRLFAAFYARPESPEALLRRAGLEPVAGVRYRQLSRGQQQRLALALALVGRPELVFLDEPTAAMDPQARRDTWGAIRDLQRRGVTVVLTTHFLDEAERLAGRIAIVDGGRLVALGTPAALTGSAGGESIRFRTRGELDPAALGAALRCGVRADEAGAYAVSAPATPDLVARLTAWLSERGVLLTDLQVGHRSLEEVYLGITGESAERAER